MASILKSAEWWFLEAMRCERLMHEFAPDSPWHSGYRNAMERALKKAAEMESENDH